MAKPLVLKAVLLGKCPRCRQGNMFVKPIHSIVGFQKMHEHCPYCGLRFAVEPGFFFGAMYVSYAFTVGILFGTGIVLYHLFGDPPLWVYLVTVPLIVLLTTPYIFKYSRILFLYLFGGVKFDEKFSRN
jgi:uncharacterized protein (DUF983 family)